MSSSIAPLPSGGGVTVIAEHRQRRDQDPRLPGEKDRHDPTDGGDEPRHDHEHHDQAAPVVDEEAVPAETLFAAALIANELPPTLISPEELKLRNGQAWLPPDSPLRLKDKLI